jgi:hypothetical protein
MPTIGVPGSICNSVGGASFGTVNSMNNTSVLPSTSSTSPGFC